MAKVLMNLARVSISLAGRIIFENVSLELQMGQRVGLVGPNGAGKSTLMRVMSDELVPDGVTEGKPDGGEVFRASGLTWARLEQEPEFAHERTVLQEALTAVPEMAEVESQLRRLEGEMAAPAVYEDPARLNKVLERHARLLDEQERLGGQRYQSQVEAALDSLGMGEDYWSRPVGTLSGGQKKLVLLAKLMVRSPDLLLLDEPDNHLDIPAKRCLEKMISAYKGCVVIISHDRYLLDEVTTHIAELENGALSHYQGNYSVYKNERELRRLRQQQLYAAQQKEITRIEAAIARFEQWAAVVVNQRHIKQARARRKMLDRMDKIDKVVDARRVNMDLEGWRGSKKVIELDSVRKTLPDGVVLWRDISYTLWHGDRVGLVGPNGTGKSMLLRQILNPDDVEAGRVKVGPSIKIGYYAQEHETLNPDQSPLEELRNLLPMSENAAVAYLNRFLFSYDQVRGRIGDLSGGERSRLQIAKLVATRPNLLLLDEPTNNLDVASIEVLEEALEEFVGTVLVVSHDRYFLDQTVDQIIELRDGTLTKFLGGYTDYLADNGRL
jgi:ATP-binding cassette subfamily F protein 3